MGAVCDQRFGYPDLDVCISRFEPLSYLLGPWAVKNPFVGYNDVLGSIEASLLETATLPSRYDASTLALRR